MEQHVQRPWCIENTSGVATTGNGGFHEGGWEVGRADMQGLVSQRGVLVSTLSTWKVVENGEERRRSGCGGVD